MSAWNGPDVEHVDGVNLQTWANDNNQDETDLIYKKGMWQQVMFVRDEIHPLFFSRSASYEERKTKPVRVVGEHTSKSVKLPVFSISGLDAEIRMRENFHGWVVSVNTHWNFKNEMTPDLFMGLLHSMKRDDELSDPFPSCYAEGFSEEWCFSPIENNGTKFTGQVSGYYPFWTFCFLLTKWLKDPENKR